MLLNLAFITIILLILSSPDHANEKYLYKKFIPIFILPSMYYNTLATVLFGLEGVELYVIKTIIVIEDIPFLRITY